MEAVTKMGIHECFTFMCYKQDANEVQNVNINGN